MGENGVVNNPPGLSCTHPFYDLCLALIGSDTVADKRSENVEKPDHLTPLQNQPAKDGLQNEADREHEHEHEHDEHADR